MQDIFEGYPVKTYGKITTRPYQQAAIDAVIEHVKKSNDPSIVSASVGAGKTIVIAGLSKHVSDKNGKVLVLSRQGEIISQDAEDCWLAECRNSLYSASLGVKSVVYPVILGTEGTVAKSLEQDVNYLSGETEAPSKLFNFVADLILIDEAHMVDFETDDSQYMKIITEMQRRNPRVKIVGLTGTPYRGIKPIIGEHESYFWRKKLTDISTEYLTQKGYLVPCQFGFGDDETSYNLDEFKSEGEEGCQDYTAEQLRQMEKLMIEAETTTEKIMIEVMHKTQNRNCVLITGAGKKHLKEAARFLPKGSYAIVTEDMGARLRKKALKDAFDGKIKYLLQVGCLTTGVNIPLIDTVVILRKIGSLTLLVQLIGRGLRLLKDFQKEAGIKKDDCLVLDYSDTLNELKDLYDNPILEEADFSKAKDENDLIQCPKCGTENSIHAVRCRNIDNNGERCDFFWKSRTCEDFYVNGVLKQSGCGAENAPTARSCRICNNTLIDPNENLSRKHYSNTEFKPVMQFKMTPCKNDGVLCQWYLPNDEVAKMFFTPFSEDKVAKRIWYNNFVKKFANTPALKKAVRQCRNAGELCQMESLLNTVSAITHRIGAGDKSVVSKVIYKEQ